MTPTSSTSIWRRKSPWRRCTRQFRPAFQTGETSLLPRAAPSSQQSAFIRGFSFEWKNGQWNYRDNSILGNFGVSVPLPGGATAAIVHQPVAHSKKTLGAMTSPDGNSTGQIAMMQEKAQGWIDAVRNGHLHCQNVWFLIGVQFWPRVGYSLCSSTATYDKLENALQKQYYQILPLGGIIEPLHETAG
jgi:hypothetical protein